ncbi:MAG: DUF192 domain-containing protein [Candidatus Desantisbacteria bacterium]
MKIINKTKNTVLAQNAIVADTVFKRIKGLLASKNFAEGEALILKPCNSIHTFFMKFPIDVLFINKNNQIIKAISSLPPFRLTYIYFNANFAIELPAGVINSTFTQAGDILTIES